MTPLSKKTYRSASGILINSHDVIYQFLQVIRDVGISYSGEIIPDGRLHRFHIEGHKPGTLNGAYVLHLDGHPAGWFQDHKTGVTQKWRPGTRRQLNHQETIALQAKIKEEERQRKIKIHNKQEQAAAEATYLHGFARLVRNQKDHPYLIKKGIQPHGVKILGNRLIIPLYDQSGRLMTILSIYPDGEKRFLPGGRKEGSFFIIGDLSEHILIAEGFATGASLHEETGKLVVVAFDKGNLLPVAKVIRSQFPDYEIFICGDNDISRAGQIAANEAAAAIGGLVLIPEEPGHDWNDVIAGGRDE